MENKELVVELYKSGLSITKIANQLNKSSTYVKSRLKDIKIRSCTEQNRKYKTDDYFFENIDNEYKSYWLGFIMADGCVYKDYLVICLSNKDKHHLEKFRDLISPERPIYEQPGRIYLQIKSKQLCKSLSKYNVVPRKTKLIKSLPNIDSKYIRHFIRGYFDADGTIYRDNDKRYKNILLRFAIYGNKPFLEEINNLLNKELGLSITKVLYGTDIFYLKKSGNKNLLKIYKYFYNDSSVFLKRKHTIFKQIAP